MGTYNKGFTLLELIIIVAIIGLTTAFAAPGLSDMIKNNRISGSANDFVAAMQYAKAEAASRVNPVTLCQRNALGTGCVADGGWQQGWIVFTDFDGSQNVNGDDEVLMRHEALHAQITFGGTGNMSTAVTYNPSGTTTITTTEEMILCDDRLFAESAKGILVTITGRGAVMKASDTSQDACI